MENLFNPSWVNAINCRTEIENFIKKNPETVFLMNSDTGSVDTEDGWKTDAKFSVGTDSEWDYESAGLLQVEFIDGNWVAPE